MLLTITTTHVPATDLGYLLHKHPARLQTFDLSCGQAHVFYPEARPERCTAALLLDIDPLQLAQTRRTPASHDFVLQPYVNDRPYVASSFLSVAIAEVFGTALSGRCHARPALAETPLSLQARLAVLPYHGGESVLRCLFEPLGYRVSLEASIGLQHQRLEAVLAALGNRGVARILDLGCGNGRLLRTLLQNARFTAVVGMDVSQRQLDRAAARLHLEDLPNQQRQRLKLIQGSLLYGDSRLVGYDAAVLIEVSEHLDPTRLEPFACVLFGYTRPGVVIVTTPNREYNVQWLRLRAGGLRHRDHRFEWTRAEFQRWAERIAEHYGYTVDLAAIGPEDPHVGSPTQMGIFTRCR